MSDSNTRLWNFQLRVGFELESEEVVCITGSTESLGEWQVTSSIPMNLSRVEDEELLWTTTLRIPLNQNVYYRYCICVFPKSHEDVIMVRQWETDITPRKISLHDTEEKSVISEFGLRANGSMPQIQRGWLTKESFIEFKLQENSVKLWRKKHQKKKIYVRFTVIDSLNDSNGGNNDIEESIDIHSENSRRPSVFWNCIEVGKLNENEVHLRRQSQFGVLYDDDEFISFQISVLQLSSVTFLVDFCLLGSDDDEVPKHVGSCYLMPEQLKSTEGKITVPILSKGFQPIGQFKANFLIVHPMNDVLCDFSLCYSRHWKDNWKGLDVGHRGSGNSFTKMQHGISSSIRENSIASLKHAFAHGADMVEFDVQLSKDLVPVIYHDFHLCTAVVNKNNEGKTLIEMPLKNLTLKQLQELKIHHLHEREEGLKEFENDDEEHQAFPTLESALCQIDSDGGFNIEIKWDMELMDGTRENHNAVEINLFVDILLQTVLKHGRSRRIVFSSFNPDICTQIRMKQNLYPVLLLITGVNTKYEPYMDRRTWNIPNASYFVEMMGILGISVMAQDIQRDPSQVQFVKAKNQVLFCWTDDQNDQETIIYLKQVGVDGIIFDRINEHNLIKKNIPIFRSEADEEDYQEFLRDKCNIQTKNDFRESSKSNSRLSFTGILKNCKISSLL